MLAPHTPKRNHLLTALPATDYGLDRPKLDARIGERFARVKWDSDRSLSGKTGIVDPFS